MSKDHEEMNRCPLSRSSAFVLLCDVSHVWSENMYFNLLKNNLEVSFVATNATMQ